MKKQFFLILSAVIYGAFAFPQILPAKSHLVKDQLPVLGNNLISVNKEDNGDLETQETAWGGGGWGGGNRGWGDDGWGGGSRGWGGGGRGWGDGGPGWGGGGRGWGGSGRGWGNGGWGGIGWGGGGWGR